MKKIEYFIFNPGGNLTALVINNHYNNHQKKQINDWILKKHQTLEQVGFIDEYKYELQMAGGEFCGNATRCAIKYYLSKNQEKEMIIKVSGMEEPLDGGSNLDEKIWVDIPVKEIKDATQEGVKIVRLEGITHIVLNEVASKKYIVNQEKLKDYAKEIIEYMKIDDKAVGVLFTEKAEEKIKLYPIVWVKDIETLFFETACGSGTVAVTACSDEKEVSVIQPSGYEITGKKILKDKGEYIKIIGVVSTDNKANIIEEELI